MKKLISAELAGKALLVLFFLLIVFHALIITGILPSEIVWAGVASNSRGDLIALEVISLSTTILFVFFVLSKLKSIRSGKPNKLINIGVWFMFLFFTVNILGNITSEVLWEKIIFTPVAVIIALLSFRLAIEK